MKKHFYWLDLLRFISAFAVLVFHYRGAFFVEYGFLPQSQHNLFTFFLYSFTRLGEQAVLIFFVVSGFLVGGKSIEQIIFNQVDIKSYIIKRFVRIFLPLIASVILVIIIDLIIGRQIPYSDLLGSLFALQGILTHWYTNGPLWSLSYEVWFYVLMGCIMVIYRVKSKKALILSFFLMTVVLVIFTTKLSPGYMLIWLLGAFAYFLPQSIQPVSKIKVLIFAGLVLAAMGLTQITSASRSVTFDFNFVNRDMTNIFLAFTACILIHNIIHFIPETKLAIKIEKMGSKLSLFSYSLYLTHFPIISLLKYWRFPKSVTLNFKSVSLYILEIIIAVSVAYLFFLLAEKHTTKVQNFLKNFKLKRTEKSKLHSYGHSDKA